MNRCTAVECRDCGTVLTDGQSHPCDGDLTLVHDHGRVRENFEPEDGDPDDHWRYAPLLPVDPTNAVSLGEGGTALVDAPTLGDGLGVDLSLKLEGANPTGSTKDRGSSVLVTYAREAGAETVACASTGNAAASLAAYAARSSLSCRLFVPDDVPDAKAVQPLVYGASVEAVDGSYDDAYDRCRTGASEDGWVDRSAGASPYTAAGARTLGYELAEQTAAPDWVVVPMGNGGTIAGAWAGFETFADLGFVEGTPRMLGVQAEGAPAIHESMQDGPTEDGDGTTCADSIDVGTPHRLADARAAIRDSGGASVTVTDDAIQQFTARLGREEGVFVEPACAAAAAGIETARERGTVDAGDTVVAVMTGSGLKDTATARQAVGLR
ncbi:MULTISPECIES: threonine synthase [Salinibaculum]|uniref:threonine synthase n=1 Tax=Salinibaculum TaxID=2732368 RepID=UPI0030D113CE